MSCPDYTAFYVRDFEHRAQTNSFCEASGVCRNRQMFVSTICYYQDQSCLHTSWCQHHPLRVIQAYYLHDPASSHEFLPEGAIYSCYRCHLQKITVEAPATISTCFRWGLLSCISSSETRRSRLSSIAYISTPRRRLTTVGVLLLQTILGNPCVHVRRMTDTGVFSVQIHSVCKVSMLNGIVW